MKPSKHMRPSLQRWRGSFESCCLQGLSHYLEHMLFMGSEKYPDENEYDSFLAKHGGSSNAFTEMVRPPQTHMSFTILAPRILMNIT